MNEGVRTAVIPISTLVLPGAASSAYEDAKYRKWVGAARKEIEASREPFCDFTRPTVVDGTVIFGWPTVVAAAASGWISLACWSKTTGLRKLTITDDQWSIMERAIARVRKHEGEKFLSDGRALELICADFLAGAGW